MSTIFSGALYHTLKKTLRNIVTDKTDGLEEGLVLKRFMDEGTMDDQYVDDLEVGGVPLASEKAEGAELSTGTLREGTLSRYNSRTFGLKMIITREAMEVVKYDQAVKLQRRLKRALYKTADIDATNVLVRAFNSSYVGGDGVSLGSASHTVPGGTTFSNIMATPLSPSTAALVIATSQLMKMPDHSGLVSGIMPKKIVCPVDQWATWAILTKSSGAPAAGEFNAINVVKTELDITEVVKNKYWSNTTTNWALITDAENGLNFLWRRKPSGDDWVDNDQQVSKFSQSARWARGWSDARGIYLVNA